MKDARRLNWLSADLTLIGIDLSALEEELETWDSGLVLEDVDTKPMFLSVSTTWF